MMENKVEAILREIRTENSASTITNSSSQINRTQNTKPTRSRNDRSIGILATNIKNSDTENEDNPLRASDMNGLRNPAESLYQNTPNLDESVIPNEDPEEEDYHIKQP